MMEVTVVSPWPETWHRAEAWHQAERGNSDAVLPVQVSPSVSAIRWWMLMAAKPRDVVVAWGLEEGSGLDVQSAPVHGAAASAAAVEGTLQLTHAKVRLSYRR